MLLLFLQVLSCSQDSVLTISFFSCFTPHEHLVNNTCKLLECRDSVDDVSDILLSICQVSHEQLILVSLANSVELDTVESNDWLTTRTSISCLITELHGEFSGWCKLELMLCPFLSIEASAFFILEHILAADNLCEVLCYG